MAVMLQGVQEPGLSRIHVRSKKATDLAGDWWSRIDFFWMMGYSNLLHTSIYYVCGGYHVLIIKL